MAIFAGNAAPNTLKGGSEDDVLKGYGGADHIIGGYGNDIALYGDSPVGVEVRLNQYAGYTGSAQGDVLVGIENLGGSPWDDFLMGDGVANVLYGVEGNDELWGMNGDDILWGGIGDDTLWGGAGRDDLYGGTGNDTYDMRFVSDVDDIHEAGGEGSDEVVTTGSFTLPNGVDIEVLRIADPSDTTPFVTLRGNSSGNSIIGSDGANDLFGGGGNDFLTGGGGNDRFYFTVAPGPANLTTVTDFDVALDTIFLRATHFPALWPTLTPDEFVIAAAAQDATDRLIYNSSNGALLYDADGSGAAQAVHFATLSPGLALTHDHFTVGLL